MSPLEGHKMHQWAKDLWPINRSLTGKGVRETLSYLKNLLPELQCHQINSGTQVFDWMIPQEWHCREAYIITPDGDKICDISECNLYLVGYSEPVRQRMSLVELKAHLHSLPEQPDRIPYVTSYYKRDWGFCLADKQLQLLSEGEYQVVIDSDLFDGQLDYADLLIKGHSDQEILLSTNICHPSLANNELAGPIMVAALGQWLSQQDLHFSYRLVFVPETIGAVAYIQQNRQQLLDRVIGGYQVVCCGDERTFSYIASPYGDNVSDDIARQVLSTRGTFDEYSFLQRGSDERQYCAPHIRLPVASICRSKYGVYPEYHNSGDDLVNVVTPLGLQGAFDVYRDCIKEFERRRPEKSSLPVRQRVAEYPSVKVLCEPQLGKRGLYDNMEQSDHPLAGIDTRTIINLISYCDGTNSVADIADRVGAVSVDCERIIDELARHELL